MAMCKASRQGGRRIVVFCMLPKLFTNQITQTLYTISFRLSFLSQKKKFVHIANFMSDERPPDPPPPIMELT